MTDQATAVSLIRAMQPDPSKFVQRARGAVDMTFGQLAQYAGYKSAVEYIETARRMWWDWQSRYAGKCLLDTSYTAFLEAEKSMPCQ